MQILLDSANVDFEPFRGKVDFVFIDADHGMSYVKSDSDNAFSMLSPQGVVLWHDYGGRWPDVARYLRKGCRKEKTISPRRDLFSCPRALALWVSDVVHKCCSDDECL